MQLKELFTIPDEKKATEKAFGRVMIFTICWTILCMTCLAGTTWAWFTASIENQENVIEIASATALVTVNGQEITQVYQPGAEGEYEICVRLEHSKEHWKVPVYVLMYVTQQETSDCYCFTFTSDGQQEQTLLLPIAKMASVSFQVSWIAPAEARPVEELEEILEEAGKTEPTETETETSAPTEETETLDESISVEEDAPPEESTVLEDTTEPKEDE